MINLEPLAAQAGQKMVAEKADHNIITKALMVVAEQGIYALGIFLKVQKEEGKAKAVHRALLSFVSASKLLDTKGFNEDFIDMKFYQKLVEGHDAEAIGRILLVKQALELALTYGRYHAKAER
jgi:hypothetical protein